MADDGFPVGDLERLRWYRLGLGVAAKAAECMAEGIDKGASVRPDSAHTLRALANILRDMESHGRPTHPGD